MKNISFIFPVFLISVEILLNLLPTGNSFAQRGLFPKVIEQKIAHIKTIFSDREELAGFGFIILEASDTLYLVTARDVVFSQDEDVSTEQVMVRFLDRKGPVKAKILGQEPRVPFALLGIKKPEGFEWVHEYLTRTSLSEYSDKSVSLLGTDGLVTGKIKKFSGAISEISAQNMKIDIIGQKGNSLGSPLVHRKDRIAGLVINDTDNQITALEISYVKNFVFKNWLKRIDLSALYNSPLFLAAGLQGGIAGAATLDDTDSNMRLASPGYGYFVQAVIGFIGLRFEIKTHSFLTKNLPTDGQFYQFGNRFSSYSCFLSLSPGDNSTTFNWFLGYTRAKINPEMRINKGEWLPLKDIDGVDYDYSRQANIFTVGLGAAYATRRRLLIGGDFRFNYSSSKYLFINIKHPFEENTGNDWYLSFNLYFGFQFIKKNTSTKILKDRIL